MAALSNYLEDKFIDLTRGQASTHQAATCVALMSGAGAWVMS